MSHIKYRAGYKYQLAEDYTINTGISGYQCGDQFLKLSDNGNLLIRSGYAWDGPSGPTNDTPDSMRGSLVHDALYQLMRLSLIPQTCRDEADELLKKLCIEDGMNHFRADVWFHGVDLFAASAASPESKKKVLIAPREYDIDEIDENQIG